MESAVSFVLGAFAGAALGATEAPVNHILTEIISGHKLIPVSSGVRSTGPLGLGALVGTTALITSMTAAVMGVIAGATVALLHLSLRRTEGRPAAGLTAALASTSSGAALGALADKLSSRHGMLGLLWPLGVFFILAQLLHVYVKSTSTISNGTLGGQIEQKGQARLLASRRRLFIAMEKYTEFLAFSSIPMTVMTFVTTGFGIFGFGGHRFVFVVLLVLVLSMSFWLMRSRRLNFWMFMACMGMFSTFAIAVLTVHAGQEVVGSSVKMSKAGQDINMESIIIGMSQASSVQALSAGLFVSEVCELALGASVGGPLVREAGARLIVGSSVAAVAILAMVKMSSPLLGVGGTSGALLGALGAVGVAMGGAAALAIKSSWRRMLTTTAGMICGFLVFGKLNVVDIGLKVCVAYIFAMTNLY